jgi:hypothetical protein
MVNKSLYIFLASFNDHFKPIKNVLAIKTAEIQAFENSKNFYWILNILNGKNHSHIDHVQYVGHVQHVITFNTSSTFNTLSTFNTPSTVNTLRYPTSGFTLVSAMMTEPTTMTNPVRSNHLE